MKGDVGKLHKQMTGLEEEIREVNKMSVIRRPKSLVLRIRLTRKVREMHHFSLMSGGGYLRAVVLLRGLRPPK